MLKKLDRYEDEKNLKKINIYIKEFNEIASVLFKGEDIDPSKKIILFYLGRMIVEGAIYFNNKKNIRNTEFIKSLNNHLVTIKWHKINDANHFKTSYNKGNKSYVKDVLECYKAVFIEKNDLITKLIRIDNNLYEVDEVWKTYDEIPNKIETINCLIINAYYYGEYNRYEISEEKNGFKEENRYFILSKNYLYKGGYYEIKTNKEFLYINNIKKREFRYVIEEYKIKNYIPSCINIADPKYRNVLQEVGNWKKEIIDSYEVPPMTHLISLYYSKEFENNDEVNSLIKIINDNFKENSKENLQKLMLIFLYIEYSDQVVLEENLKPFMPLIYEYWTKNSRIKALTNKFMFFSLLEKTNVLYLIELNTIVKSPFFAMNNDLLSKNLKRKNEYFSPFEKNWKEIYNDGTFSYAYSEKKIVKFEYKGKNVLTTNDKHVLLKNLISLLKSNKILKTSEIENKNHYFNGLDHSQEEAFEFIIKNKVSILSSPAGYGKTHVIGKIIEFLYEHENEKSTLFLGPTRMSSEIFKNNQNIRDKFLFSTIKNLELNEHILEECENIFIDEISMIDDEYWSFLLEKIKDKKRIIFSGDEHQIPPFYSVGLYKIIFNDFPSNTIKLKINHRQKDNKKFINFINHFKKNKKFIDSSYFEVYSNISEFANCIEENNDGTWQYLTPINNGIYGVDGINNLSCNEDCDEIKIGDKVIIKHFTPQNKELKKLISPGEIFEIKEIKNNIYRFNMSFEEYEEIKEPSGWFIKNNNLFFKDNNNNNNLPFSKSTAMTINKSQGSTFKNIFLVIPPNHQLDWRLIYTAISRPSNKLKIFIYEKDLEKYLTK